MSIRFDDKGKFFTDVVSKDAVPVIIQTVTHCIEGVFHVRPNERLSDEINKPDQFFAVTEATIFSNSGEKLYTCEFFAINRDQVVWILPKDQVMNDERS